MKVSILVPFREEADTNRGENWEWLAARWRALMPDTELIVGTDAGMPFSKTVAVNDAYSRATGDVFIIADADSWCSTSQIAEAVRYATYHHCLVVPWWTAHRLTLADSEAIRQMDPATRNPVSKEMLRNVEDYRPSPSTAAMVVVIERQGFERVGGMDPRFRGWGAEDVAFGLACGTLLGQTKLMLGEAYALFHDRRRVEGKRVWEGDSGGHNMKLGDRYWSAKDSVTVMAELCAEHPLRGAKTPIGAAPWARPAPPLLVREFLVGEFRDGDTVVV